MPEEGAAVPGQLLTPELWPPRQERQQSESPGSWVPGPPRPVKTISVRHGMRPATSGSGTLPTEASGTDSDRLATFFTSA